MIEVTKLGGGRLIVNADHIETVEAQPDTVLVLNNGKHIIVREDVAEVVRKIVEYQQLVRSGLSATAPRSRGGADPGGSEANPGGSEANPGGSGSGGIDGTKAED